MTSIKATTISKSFKFLTLFFLLCDIIVREMVFPQLQHVICTRPKFTNTPTDQSFLLTLYQK